jgi:tetratricopeptide (TPR) repeat protein
MRSHVARALGQLGNTYMLQKDIGNGMSYLQRAFEVARDGGIAADATLWAGNLAQAHIDSRQWDEAERYNEEAKRLWTTTRSGKAVYYTLNSAGIAFGRRQIEVASRLYEQALGTQNAPPAVVWGAHYGLAEAAIAQTTGLRRPHLEAVLNIIE